MTSESWRERMSEIKFKLAYEELGKLKVKEVQAKYNQLTTDTIASYVAITVLIIVSLIIGRYT